MKFKITMILLSCLMLCSCENGTHGSLTVSRNEPEITTTTAIGTTSPMSAVTTRNDVPASEEAAKEIMIPTSFTENEEWLHAFIELNFEDAYRFAWLENAGINGDVEVCVAGDDHIEIYGRMNDTGSFANAEKYRESLSEYYSADIVDIFMDNVTIVKKAEETDERYYNVEGIDGRIYVEIADEQKHNESTEPVTRLTKYIEIDGVMYKDTGESTRGTQGVFEYSKIVSMTDDEIIFTYPIKQDHTDEFILIGIAEGRLVKENEKWKFGWHLSDDNFTDAYDDIWYDIELLCPPFRNRTLENYNEQWSEDDIIAAWNMTDASDVYMEYTDRLFCDIDMDSSVELLLTSYSTQKMYFFKKANNIVKMLFELIDIDITNGNILMPPTDKDIIETKEVFDFQECNSFKLYNQDENIYVTGISWRPAVGKTCWVKKLILSNDDIGFVDVFRWGMFTKNDIIASVFEYRQYDCNGNYTCTTQQEIDDFLLLLCGSILYENDKTSMELESVTDEPYSSISEAFNDDRTIALRKEKCTKTLVDSFQREAVNELTCSSEQEIIYDLMDRDVICYYTFRYASSAIEEETQYQGDIFEIKKHALFKSYSELKKYVYDTYTEENAEKLLKESDPDRALYLSEDQLFLYHAENLGIVNFDIFSEGYEIEITNVSDDEIEFICYYSVWQDEEMKPVEKAFLCHAQKTEGDLWKLDRNVWLYG